MLTSDSWFPLVFLTPLVLEENLRGYVAQFFTNTILITSNSRALKASLADGV